ANIIGIIGSALCIIHCLALPFLFLVSHWVIFHPPMEEHTFHLIFILIAVTSVYASTLKAEKKLIKRLMWASVTVFSLALFFHDAWSSMIYVSLFASFMLIFLHILNQKEHNGR